MLLVLQIALGIVLGAVILATLPIWLRAAGYALMAAVVVFALLLGGALIESKWPRVDTTREASVLTSESTSLAQVAPPPIDTKPTNLNSQKVSTGNKVLGACILITAQTYQVPPGVLLGILQVRDGQLGKEYPNPHSGIDYGLMRINSKWAEILSRKWETDTATAIKWITNDACVSVAVAGWILRQSINSHGDLWKGIAGYPDFPDEKGDTFSKQVRDAMIKYNLTDRMDLVSVKNGELIPITPPKLNQDLPYFTECTPEGCHNPRIPQ